MRVWWYSFFIVVLLLSQGVGRSQDIIQEIIFAPLPTAAKASTPSPSKRLSCTQTAKPPVIDGRLDDACWANAAKAEGFVISGSGRVPGEATAAKIVYDKRAIYVGFVCHESQMSKLVLPKRPHDYPMWNDDVVEILLDPSDQRTDDYHFILNASGAQYEGHEQFVPDLRGGHMDEGPKWNGAWQGAVFHGADFWLAEIAIPFASLGLRKAPENTVWASELMREEQPRGEVTIWSCASGGFGRMGNWGCVAFGNPEVLIRGLTVDKPGWGQNVARLSLENPGAKPVQIVVTPDIALKDRAVAAGQKSVVVSLARGEAKDIEMPFNVTASGERYEVTVTCMDAGRKRVLATRSVHFDMPRLLELSLTQDLLYISESVLVARVEIGATASSLSGLRLVGMMKAPGGKLIESKPVQCAGRRGEVVFRVPSGGAGEYLVGIVLVDAAGKDVASRETRFHRIRGPFDY